MGDSVSRSSLLLAHPTVLQFGYCWRKCGCLVLKAVNISKGEQFNPDLLIFPTNRTRLVDPPGLGGWLISDSIVQYFDMSASREVLSGRRARAC